MSDHLPECLRIVGKAGPCICWCLRACGQRVLEEADPNAWVAKSRLMEQRGEARGYAAGVQDARDAVAALPSWNYTYGGNPPMVEGPPMFGAWMVKAKALAAIDALREPPHVDPCDCDRCRAAALRGES